MKTNHHGQLTRQIVLCLLKLDKKRQSELMQEAVAFLHAQCGEQVGTLHDFLTTPPDKVLTHEVKEKLLGVIVRAIRDNDSAPLHPP